MVTFYCQASGSPLPTINWTRIGGNIPSDRQSQPQPGALQISNLKPTDDGLYACVARNSQGKKVAYVHLSIKGINYCALCYIGLYKLPVTIRNHAY